jgi:hypothetical protein
MLVYPAYTTSLVSSDELKSRDFESNTEEHLRTVIRSILGTGRVKAIIYSLIAKINEVRAT